MGSTERRKRKAEVLGCRWRSVCVCGIRGRSGFTTETKLTAFLSRLCPMMHCKPSHTAPKTHTAVPEGWILSLSSLPLPFLLSLSLLSYICISTSKQITSSHPHVNPKILLSYHKKHQPLYLSVFYFLLLQSLNLFLWLDPNKFDSYLQTNNGATML